MKSELRTVTSLALLYAIRMLGLFMVLPVLSVAGLSYEAATAATLGLALGIYGLTQACFQIPLGLLSDFIGRKPVILIGLALFAVGSLVAAFSTSVYGLIIGRALQGSGAIASTIMALVADLTSEESRTKAMAAIGASIGLSFTLSLILGPALSSWIGLDGLFIIAFVFSLLGVALLLFAVPSPASLGRTHRDSGAIPALLAKTFVKPDLARLNIGIFVLHAVLTAMFVAVPSLLVERVGLDVEQHWKIYCPVLLLSFIGMVPLMIMAEKKGKAKEAFISAILLLSIAFFAFANVGATSFILVLFLFFVAFNLLEAMLPSMVSKLAPAGSKGTAMGLYSTWQFMGAFVGGALGGLLVSRFGHALLFYICSAACVFWAVVAMFMVRPKQLSSMCFKVGPLVNELDITSFKGVEDAVYVADDGLLYLKVDKKQLDLVGLRAAVDKYAS